MLYFVNCIVCLFVGSGRFCMLVALSCIDVLFADWIIIIIIITIIFLRIESTSVHPLSSYRRWSVTVPQVSKALPCSCWLWNRRHFDIDIVILILWYWFRDIDVIFIFWNWSCDIDIVVLISWYDGANWICPAKRWCYGEYTNVCQKFHLTM